ncbi:MAG TPA: AarF/ABC1/UbiB kinase family protein [Thermoplasmataceae archaeon]|nr:AarF/ABC1/UbiB kinase family protein [Thermoplasmataceae archaeon]
MPDSNDPFKGLRRQELRVFLKLAPIIRRYLKDRRRAREENEEAAWSTMRERNGQRAVETFFSLGPTFIKLGQVLSARPDLLPKEYIASFEQLQDRVPPAPFSHAKEIIERNLGKIDDVFEEFNEEAISGASLGQVYLAKYKGQNVAVKVNRPRIEFILKRDLEVISRLLKLLRRRIENFLYISVSNVIIDFKGRIYDEIDYRKEAENSNRIRENLLKREDALIPRVINEISGKEVMVTEYIIGTKITDIEGLKKNNVDMQDLAFRVDLAFMRMLLRDDIFHADPHPGNISVTPEGRNILYDFGMVGNLDDETRFSLLSLYDGLMKKDPELIIDALLSLNALSPAANRGVIRRSIEIAMTSLSGRSANDAEIRELMEIANGVIFEFPFRLPRSLVLYMRMSSLLEGICKTLDPEFKFVRVMRELLYREGLLDELYRKQMSEFVKRAAVSIEKGLDVIPMLKRRLEDIEAPQQQKTSNKVPGSLFLGFILLGSIYVMNLHPIISYIVIVADLIAFAVLMTRK